MIHFYVCQWSCILEETKLTLTTTSTMEAEFVYCFEAASYGVWLKSFISELRIVDSISKLLRIYFDNSAIIFMAENNKSSSRSTSTLSV